MPAKTTAAAAATLPAGWAGAGDSLRPCECGLVVTGGCAATTARRFAPGHDARLVSFLLRALRAGRETITVQTPTGPVDAPIAQVAARWPALAAKVATARAADAAAGRP